MGELRESGRGWSGWRSGVAACGRGSIQGRLPGGEGRCRRQQAHESQRGEVGWNGLARRRQLSGQHCAFPSSEPRGAKAGGAGPPCCRRNRLPESGLRMSTGPGRRGDTLPLACSRPCVRPPVRPKRPPACAPPEPASCERPPPLPVSGPESLPVSFTVGTRVGGKATGFLCSRGRRGRCSPTARVCHHACGCVCPCTCA